MTMMQYLLGRENRALKLPNRGPLKFNDNEDVNSDILEGYSKFGFYIFESALPK